MLEPNPVTRMWVTPAVMWRGRVRAACCSSAEWGWASLSPCVAQGPSRHNTPTPQQHPQHSRDNKRGSNNSKPHSDMKVSFSLKVDPTDFLMGWTTWSIKSVAMSNLLVCSSVTTCFRILFQAPTFSNPYAIPSNISIATIYISSYLSFSDNVLSSKKEKFLGVKIYLFCMKRILSSHI